MSLTAGNLVGYLRAEFAKSGRLRVWLFVIQLAVALPGAISVIVPDDHKITLYVLALVGVALLIAWWFLNDKYVRARSAAQGARRASVLIGGLGETLSASEIQSLRKRFTVKEAEARASEQTDYYATKLAPGPARLAEMLEESALYTEALQRISAKAMLLVLGIFILVFIGLTLAVTPFVERDTFYVAMRVFLAMLVFAMSADVLGAYRLHRQAAEEVADVRNRLMIADKNGYPLPDVLLIFTDYNTAVESAPESVPFAYRLYRDELEKQWKMYQDDRKRERAKR
jgi:hypothetical protein